MMIKKIGIVLLLTSSLFLTIHSGTCGVVDVIADAVTQANKMVQSYENAKTPAGKECLEKQMRSLLAQLKHQQTVYKDASDDEAMSGELDASIVNQQEQVQLGQAITIIENKLKSVDATKPVKVNSPRPVKK